MPAAKKPKLIHKRLLYGHECSPCSHRSRYLNKHINISVVETHEASERVRETEYQQEMERERQLRAREREMGTEGKNTWK